MIKTGDLVGWSSTTDHTKLEDLEDLGVVVSIYCVDEFAGPKRIRIAWRRDPDLPIDEYPFDWAEAEMGVGALIILRQS